MEKRPRWLEIATESGSPLVKKRGIYRRLMDTYRPPVTIEVDDEMKEAVYEAQLFLKVKSREKQARKTHNRRKLLFAAGGLVGAVVVFNRAMPSLRSDVPAEIPAAGQDENYIGRAPSGNLVHVSSPQVQSITFTDHDYAQGKIPVYTSPGEAVLNKSFVDISLIQAQTAAQVSGGVTQERKNIAPVDDTARTIAAGIWYKLMDEQGRAIGLDGTVQAPGALNYYIPSNAVQIVNPAR